MFIQDNSIAEETKRDHLPRTAHSSRPCSCRWLCWSSSGLSTLGGDPSLGQLRSSSTFPTLLTQTDAVFLKKNTLPGCGSVVSAVEIRTHRVFLVGHSSWVRYPGYKQLSIYLDIWGVGQWSQPGGGGLDVAGLCSSEVWDGGERMKGWCRLTHEEAQGCETAVTVPSRVHKMVLCVYSLQLLFNALISAMNYSFFFSPAQPLQLFPHAFDTT